MASSVRLAATMSISAFFESVRRSDRTAMRRESSSDSESESFSAGSKYVTTLKGSTSSSDSVSESFSDSEAEDADE